LNVKRNILYFYFV